MKCEALKCKEKVQMEVTMPTALGIFTADMCIKCGLKIHYDKEMFDGILKNRAKKRKISLPTSPQNIEKLLKKESKKR